MLNGVQAFRGHRLTRGFLWSAAGLVVIASLIQLPQGSTSIAHSDKWLHGICYAVLMLLAGWGWPASRSRMVSLACLLIMGLAIELLQGMLPWRSMEWLDLLANGAGLISGLLIVGLLDRSTPRLKERS